MLASALWHAAVRALPPKRIPHSQSLRSTQTRSLQSQQTPSQVDYAESSSGRVTRLLNEVSKLKEEQQKLQKQILESTSKQEKLNKKYMTRRSMVIFFLLDAGLMLHSNGHEVQGTWTVKSEESISQRQGPEGVPTT